VAEIDPAVLLTVFLAATAHPTTQDQRRLTLGGRVSAAEHGEQEPEPQEAQQDQFPPRITQPQETSSQLQTHEAGRER